MVLADLDGDVATAVAAGLQGPGTARGTALDVTDAAAVQAVVDGFVAKQRERALTHR